MMCQEVSQILQSSQRELLSTILSLHSQWELGCVYPAGGACFYDIIEKKKVWMKQLMR